jgi:eukaryotic-like serine/threonine-protein kinase
VDADEGGGTSQGLASLRQAAQNQEVRDTRREIERIAAVSEAHFRQSKADDAIGELTAIMNEELLSSITRTAPTAQTKRVGQGWEVRLGAACLSYREPTLVESGGLQFDVLAAGSLELRVPGGRDGYQGRSHSLWFCDAQQEGEFQWFETAFMVMAFVGQSRFIDPFALQPSSEEARGAIRPGVATFQVACPFRVVAAPTIDEFLDPWLGWLAQAVQGQLARPRQIPESPPAGTWRAG